MKILYFLLPVLLFCGPAAAETVTLKSGMRLEGRIIELSDRHVILDRDNKLYEFSFTDLEEGSVDYLRTLPKVVRKPASVPVPAPVETAPPVVESDPFEEGLKYMDAGDCARAIQFFSKAIERNPRDFDAYTHRAYCSGLANQIDQAIADNLQALTIEPAAVEVRKMIAFLYLRKEAGVEAVQYLSEYLKSFPEDGEAYYGLALGLYFAEDYTGAGKAAVIAAQKGYPVPEGFIAQLKQAEMAHRSRLRAAQAAPVESLEQANDEEQAAAKAAQVRRLLPNPWTLLFSLLGLALLLVLFSKTNRLAIEDCIKPGINKRVCAFLIDIYAANLLGLAVAGFGWIWGGMLLTSLYFLFRDVLYGQSIGKRIIGLQVVQQDHMPASVSHAVLRNAAISIATFLPALHKIFGLAFLGILLFEFVTMAAQKDGRRFGDRMGSTKVHDLRPELREQTCFLIAAALGFGCLFIYLYAFAQVRMIAG